jgi:hypothetical protein
LRQSPRSTPLAGKAGKPSRDRHELLVNIAHGKVRHPLKCASLAGLSLQPVRSITG